MARRNIFFSLSVLGLLMLYIGCAPNEYVGGGTPTSPPTGPAASPTHSPTGQLPGSGGKPPDTPTETIDEQIKKKFGRGINEKNAAGFTPLQEAVKGGDAAGVKLALQHGAVQMDVVDEKDNYNKATPLLDALDTHPVNTEIVQALIERGADVNYTDTHTLHQWTPLHTVIIRDNIEALDLLLKAHKIDPNKSIRGRGSPLRAAAVDGKLEAIRKLLAHTRINPDRADVISGAKLTVGSANEEKRKKMADALSSNPAKLTVTAAELRW